MLFSPDANSSFMVFHKTLTAIASLSPELQSILHSSPSSNLSQQVYYGVYITTISLYAQWLGVYLANFAPLNYSYSPSSLFCTASNHHSLYSSQFIFLSTLY